MKNPYLHNIPEDGQQSLSALLSGKVRKESLLWIYSPTLLYLHWVSCGKQSHAFHIGASHDVDAQVLIRSAGL